MPVPTRCTCADPRQCRALATPAGAPASTGSPAAFDALYQRPDKGEIYTPDAAEIERTLAELSRLRPVGDGTRDLRYRTLYCSGGFPDDAKAAFAFAEDGLQRARRVGDQDAEVRFQYCRGSDRPMPLHSLDDFEAGIALARKLKSSRLEADGLTARGLVQSLLGEQGRAVLDLLAAQRLYGRAGRKDDAEANLLNLAIPYRRMGDLDKALDYLRQSESYAQRIGDWSGLLSSLMQQAYLAEDQGQSDAALQTYARAGRPGAGARGPCLPARAAQVRPARPRRRRGVPGEALYRAKQGGRNRVDQG